VHNDNNEMGQNWDKQEVQQLALKYFDADGDMHMECWDLDNVFMVEDWGG